MRNRGITLSFSTVEKFCTDVAKKWTKENAGGEGQRHKIKWYQIPKSCVGYILGSRVKGLKYSERPGFRTRTALPLTGIMGVEYILVYVIPLKSPAPCGSGMAGG